jgi:PhnB protein
MKASIAPGLTVSDGPRAADHYKAAFGAVERYRLDDGGRVVVAQLAIGEADFWIAEDRAFSPGVTLLCQPRRPPPTPGSMIPAVIG